MASRRMIDPNFWSSESLMECDYRQRLLFLGIVSNADDQGRLKGNPKLVKAAVFPFDDLSADDVQADIDMLVDAECIALYKVGSKTCIQILNWWDYQHPQWAYPSELPAMQGWKDQLRYRQGGQVLTDNWKGESKPDATNTEPPTGNGLNGSEADYYTQLGKALPKETPKALGGSIVVGLGIELEQTNNNNAHVTDDGSDLGFGDRLQDIDDGYKSIVDAYKNEIGVLSEKIDGYIQAELNETRERLKKSPQGSETAEEWILYAIDKAVLANVRRWDYVQKVIDNIAETGSLSTHKMGKPKGKSNGQARTYSSKRGITPAKTGRSPYEATGKTVGRAGLPLPQIGGLSN